MSIFDPIEKLITEHGSAATLRERIALIREQHEAQIADLKSNLDKVLIERDAAIALHKAALVEIQRLTKTVEGLRPKDDLQQDEIAILKFLAQIERSLPVDAVVQALSLDLTRTRFFLTKLEHSNLVQGSHYFTGQKTSYCIAHAGREYLITRGLI